MLELHSVLSKINANYYNFSETELWISTQELSQVVQIV